MSLEGKAEGKTLVGKINRCDMLTISAYGIAVKNGFEGTEAEWLASLKGDKGADGYTPVKGVDYFTEDEKAATVAEVEAACIGDIDTALDNIIAIQESLIGGGSV